MPLSDTPTLGAGTVMAFEDPNNAGVFIDLLNTLEIGPVGGTGVNSIDVSPIASLTQITVPGRSDAVDGTLIFNDVADAAQSQFFALAVAKAVVNMRITYRWGRIATAERGLGGLRVPNPEAQTQGQMEVDFTQSSDPVFTEAA